MSTRVAEVIAMGGEILIWLEPQGLSGVRLQMRLPERAMRRYPVTPGTEVTVCLRSADIIPLTANPGDCHPGGARRCPPAATPFVLEE